MLPEMLLLLLFIVLLIFVHYKQNTKTRRKENKTSFCESVNVM